MQKRCMKHIVYTTITLSLVLALLIPASYGTLSTRLDISDYPSFFIDDDVVEAISIVGSNAPAADVAHTIRIFSTLQSEGYQVPIEQVIFAEDIGDVNDYNAFVIGTPCDNPAVMTLLGLSGDCADAIPSGDSILEVHEQNGNVQLLISGATQALVEDAIDELMGGSIRESTPTPTPSPTPFVITLPPFCVDDDQGFKPFTSSNTRTREETFWDSCTENVLTEGACDENLHVIKSTFVCPYGCQNGACTPFGGVFSYDNGLAFDAEGCPEESCSLAGQGCIGGREITVETCIQQITVLGACTPVEFMRTVPSGTACNITNCTGCALNDNDCLPFGSRLLLNGSAVYCGLTSTMEQQQGIGKNCQHSYQCGLQHCQGGICSPLCTGCLVASICHSLGDINPEQYCGMDGELAMKKEEGSSCTEPYECKTMLCREGKCSHYTWWERLLAWMNSVFS